MTGDNIYLLSALPGLGDLGSIPPMSLAELLGHVYDSEGNHILLSALLLSDDLLQRQAFLSGEVDQVYPTVLTSAQAEGEKPLPEYLVRGSREDGSPLQHDLTWESYYHYATYVADETKSEFLHQWVEFEVGIRNALVIARSKALNLDPQGYLVAQDVGRGKDDFTEIVTEWSAAPDPFAGLRVLDEARWKWIGENDGWFTFKDDELAAYGARLMLLQRWHRLDKDIAAQMGETSLD